MQKVLLALIVLLFGYSAFSAQKLVVKERIAVYRKKNTTKPVFFLKPGMIIPISSKSFGDWRMIYLKKKKKKFRAWIDVSKIKKSRLVFGSDSYLEGHNKKPSYLGATFVYNYTWMGEQRVVDESGLSSNFDSMSGSASYFGFNYDIPYKKTSHLLRFHLSFSKAAIIGEGKYDGSGDAAIVDMKQDFVSAHFLMKFHSSPSSSFWYSLGAGLDKGTTVLLTIDDSSESLSGDSLPFYLRLIMGAGYDYRISKKYYLESAMSLSYVGNADKTIVPIDLSVGLKKRF